MLTEEQKKLELIKNLSDKMFRLNNIYYIATEEGETVKFKLNTIQKKILKEQSGSRDLILKYRQGGVSTLKIIELLDDCLFGGTNRSNVFITHRQDLLNEFFKKARFIYDMIPKNVKALIPIPSVDNANEMYFAETRSGKPLHNSIKISLNVRGRTPTMVHVSEFAFMDIGKQRELKQQIDNFRKVRITIETTANGIGDIFYSMCMNAKNKKGTYKLLFYPWYIEERNMFEVPKDLEFCYTPDEENLKQNYPFLTKEQIYWRRLKIEDANSLGFNGLEKFHEENPITIESAFISSGSSVFDLTAKYNIVKHIEEFEGFKIFQEPQDGIIIGVDIAEGGNLGDFSTIVAYNREGDLIFHYKGRVNEELLAKKMNSILNYSKNGKMFIGWIIPENNTGRLFIKECRAYNWFYMMHGEIKTDIPINEGNESNKYGFRTTSGSKDFIIRTYKGAIHRGEVQVSEEIKAEIDTYIFDKSNRPNAISPNHDDLLMASMIAYLGVTKIYGLEYDEKEEKLGDRADELVRKDINNLGKIDLRQETEIIRDDYYGYEEFTI